MQRRLRVLQLVGGNLLQCNNKFTRNFSVIHGRAQQLIIPQQQQTLPAVFTRRSDNYPAVLHFALYRSGASSSRQFASNFVYEQFSCGTGSCVVLRQRDREFSANCQRSQRRAYFVTTESRNIQKFNEKMAPILAPTIKLSSGYEMPVLGLGTYELKKSKCENAVRHAIEMGYRHIDTAYLYRNEALIGKVLKEQLERGAVRREDIFLVTKLWNIFHEPEKVKYACGKQLQALGVSYIDLYLMHSPVGCKYVDDDALMPHENDVLQTNDIDYIDTYKAMEQLVQLGWVRSLGLSNFNSLQIQRILDTCNIRPVTNQSKNNEAEIAVKRAIDVGYRHIDTAYFYQNEAEVGQAIRDKIAEGVVKREDIFLVTKLWNIHHEPERVEGACRKQLALLGLDYIDLYLMHLPVGYKFVDEESLLPKNEAGVLQLSDVDYVDTWRAMEKLVQLGLVHSIGVSNFNSEQIQRVLDNCEIKPVTNQVECSPALNQKKLTQFCKQNGMTLTAYCPLGRPNPAEKTPEFYYSAKTKAIADKHNKTPAQIVLRYLVEIGTIPIPKSANAQRIEENFNIFDFKLSPEDIATMDEYNSGHRLVPFSLIKGQNHKYWPFNIEF